MAANNDRGSDGAEETEVEEADGTLVVTVLLPKKAVARIDARAAHLGCGLVRAEVLLKLLRRALDAEEKAAAGEPTLN
jgi:hypothetical protein